MITLDDALRIRNNLCHPRLVYDRVVEKEDFWFIEHSTMGSYGVIIDKEDGHFMTLGSGLSLEQWFSAHKLGFRHDRFKFRITFIRDKELLLRLLWDMRYTKVRTAVDSLPLELSFDWSCYPILSRLLASEFFDFEIVASSCENTDCRFIGSKIIDRNGQRKEA